MFKDHEISSDEFYDPKFYKYASHEIIESNYLMIGAIIASFNSLENSINEELIEYINQDIEEIGWIIISDLPFSNKFNLWKKICSFYFEFIQDLKLKSKIKSEFEILSKKIENSMKLRNKIAHADWDNINENLFVKTKTSLANSEIKHKYIEIDSSLFDKIKLEFLETEELFSKFSKKIEALM